MTAVLSWVREKALYSGFDYSGMGAFLFVFSCGRGFLQSTYEEGLEKNFTSGPLDQKLFWDSKRTIVGV